MKIYENEFMVNNLIDDGNTLELDWKSGTANMKAADFKACLYIYAGFSIEHKTRNLLILIHQFQFGGAMSDDLTEWRNNNIFPKYNEAGAKKMAFLGNAEHLPPADPPRHALANFDTRFFSDKAEMEAWLRS